MHTLRQRTQRASPSTPVLAIVDTSELRWFAPGHVPQLVVDWFTAGGTQGVFEERADRYRLDGRVDVGVKRRFGHRLELKQRRAAGASAALTPALSGLAEEWRRWSPAEGLVESLDQALWIDVRKAVVKRRFAPNGVELRVAPAMPVSGGCDVEVTAITVGAVEAWSLALSAFGPEGSRTAVMETAWAALTAPRPCPHEIETMFDACCGYPEWLKGIGVSGASFDEFDHLDQGLSAAG